MSTMEQALRDEIAWHEAIIDWLARGGTGPAYTRLGAHRARLAALTAALPAPGVEAPGENLTRDHLEIGIKWIEMALRDATPGEHDVWVDAGGLECILRAAKSMLAATPSAPAEISQAQAQAMREALEIIAEEGVTGIGEGDAFVPNYQIAYEMQRDTARAALTPEPPR